MDNSGFVGRDAKYTSCRFHATTIFCPGEKSISIGRMVEKRPVDAAFLTLLLKSTASQGPHSGVIHEAIEKRNTNAYIQPLQYFNRPINLPIKSFSCLRLSSSRPWRPSSVIRRHREPTLSFILTVSFVSWSRKVNELRGEMPTEREQETQDKPRRKKSNHLFNLLFFFRIEPPPRCREDCYYTHWYIAEQVVDEGMNRIRRGIDCCFSNELF